MRTIGFFQARDELNRAFLQEGTSMPAPARAIFRFLLESVFYGGSAYGWVNHGCCGVKTIAAITGFGERAVRTHLNMLEANGLIRRVPRPRTDGGRDPDEIQVTWTYLYSEPAPHAPPAPRAGSADRSAGSDPPETAPRAGSYIPQDIFKKDKNPGDAREGADVIEMAQRRRAHV